MGAHSHRIVEATSLEPIRIEAVRRVLAGEKPEVVVRSLGFSRGCIYQWLKRYRLGGWEALKAGRITGRPRRLTATQRDWVCDTLARENPLHLNFASALWTRGMVATLIQERFQVGLSRASVVRLLRELGLASRKPWRPATESDQALTKQWLRTEFRQIESEAKRIRAEIVFLDVAEWVTRSGSARQVLSAVSRKGPMRFMVTQHPDGAGSLSEFLRRLTHGTTRPVFLVLPARWNCCADACEPCRQEFKGRLRMFALPTATPAREPFGQSRAIGPTMPRALGAMSPPLPGLVASPARVAAPRCSAAHHGACFFMDARALSTNPLAPP